MSDAAKLRDIDRRAREAAAAYKREAVALVAEVYDREGTQAKAAKALGVSQGRVSQLLAERATEEVHHLARADEEGTETRTVRVVRYGDSAVEVHVCGTTDGTPSGPERIEIASTPPRHEDADEAEERLAAYLADLEAEGYR